MREQDIFSIGDIYGGMLNDVKRNITESKEPKTFEGEFRSKKFKDGPENADGYNKLKNEVEKEEDEEDDVSKYLPKKKKPFNKKEEDEEVEVGVDVEVEDEDEDEDEDSDEEIVKEEDEEILESKKIAKSRLNKHMSKSAFDTLFNKVLKENFGQPEEGDDLGALGLDDSTPDSDMDEDFGGEEDDFGGEEDSVTFTLDRATAQTLIDVLQGAIGDGGEEDFGDEGDDDLDFGGEDDFGDEGDDMNFDEDEEEQGTKPAPDKKAVFQAKSNKVGGRANPKGGNKAKTDVTDETGTKDGAPPITALQGKSNQVPGSTLKGKQDYFR